MKHLFSLFILLIISPFSLAQEHQDTANRVQCEISIISFGKTKIAGSLYFKNWDSKFTPVMPRSSSVADSVEYIGPPQLTLYTKGPNQDQPYSPIGTCALSPSLNRAIIVVYPTEESKYSFQVIDASADKFPLGARMIINRTSSSIRGYHSTLPNFKTKEVSKKSEFCVGINKHTLVLPLEVDAAPMKGYYCQMEYMNGSSPALWNTLLKSRWFHHPEQRHLLFVHTQNGRFHVKGFSDSTIKAVKYIPTLPAKQNAVKKTNENAFIDFFKQLQQHIQQATTAANSGPIPEL